MESVAKRYFPGGKTLTRIMIVRRDYIESGYSPVKESSRFDSQLKQIFRVQCKLRK